MKKNELTYADLAACYEGKPVTASTIVHPNPRVEELHRKLDAECDAARDRDQTGERKKIVSAKRVQLFFGNLDRTTKEHTVTDLFKAFDQTAKTRFIKDGDQLRGFGFCMVDGVNAERIIKSLNGYKLGNRALAVKYAK